MNTRDSWPHNAWQAAAQTPLWLDSPHRPAPRPILKGHYDVDLLIVGGGFTGLWTALRAAERSPSRRILLVEGDRVGGQASGRNGGFCDASLTHGDENGLSRWPEEFETLRRLGAENLDGIEASIERYDIDCSFVRATSLHVATRPHEAAHLTPDAPGYLDTDGVRAILKSPTYLAGVRAEGHVALLDPARLAWGLADAAESHGVVIAERSRLTSLARAGQRVEARGEGATVNARHVVLATSAFPSLVRRLRWHTVPVYDYVLATEPLTTEQLEETGWTPRLGVSDAGNRFHYYRLTPDNRILWGGYDAVYHYGRSIRAQHLENPDTFSTLAANFGRTFPQLDGVRFTHRWAGVIDVSTRFCAYFGTAYRGRVAYAAGFTGLGVGASRFAADTALDLLDGEDTERTRLRMVRRRGIPFPPEPLAWLAIRITQAALAREDRTGRRGPWLRLLDRLGLGFDS